jgi:MFS family permease
VSEPKARVPRNVKILGVVSLLTDASSEAVYPILPLFVTNVLHAPVSAVGLIESIAEATGAFMRIGSGWLSDRLGKRKGLIATGYTLSNIAKPLLAFTATWPAVLFLRWADRVGKGIRTAPRDALIADSSTNATRGRDFGVHRALDTVGAAIGPLTAWAILTIKPGGYRTVFLVSAIPGTLAIILVFVAVADVRAKKQSTKVARPRIRFRHLGRPFAVFTAISAVFALGNSSDALLVLRAQDLGTKASLIPLMYFLFNVVGAAISTPIGSLSDRVGRRKVLLGGFGGYALVYAGFALAHGSIAPWLLFAAYGIPYAMTESITRAFVVDLVPTRLRATALGSYTFVIGLAALPSSTGAGIVWDKVAHWAPFAIDAALMGIATIALAFAGKALARAKDSTSLGEDAL